MEFETVPLDVLFRPGTIRERKSKWDTLWKQVIEVADSRAIIVSFSDEENLSVKAHSMRSALHYYLERRQLPYRGHTYKLIGNQVAVWATTKDK